MKTIVTFLCGVFLAVLAAGCVFKKPTQDNSYDPNCGGVTMESAESCFKLEVVEVVAPALSFSGLGSGTIDYYYRTSDNCYRNSNGTFRTTSTQPGGSTCGLTPHSSKLAALQSIVVSFSSLNCAPEVTVDAVGLVNVAAGVQNGSCNIKVQLSGGGYKGSAPSVDAVVAVNIGVSFVTTSFTTASHSCVTNIPTAYAATNIIHFNDGVDYTFSSGALSNTSWSYAGSGGSVNASGVFTTNGVMGGASGTVSFTATVRGKTVTVPFNITIVDGVYVSNTATPPSGFSQGNDATDTGCLLTPYATVQPAIAKASSFPTLSKRKVYVAVGNYTANYQASPIVLAEGVSLAGGYATDFAGIPTPVATTHNCNALTTSCLIDNTTAAGSRVVTFGSGITTATVIDGFYIAASSAQNLTGGSSNVAILGSASGTPTIQNNTIFGGAPVAGTGSFTLTAIEAQSSVVIRNNFVIGGIGPVNASGATVRAIYSFNGLNGVLANNIIEAGSNAGRATTYALQLTNGCHPTLTNNTIISAWGHAIYMEDYFASANPFDGKITNNIIAWGGGNSALREQHSKGPPRSIENNAFYPLNSSATTIYQLASTIAALEAYGMNGGNDKARGNILLPTGAAGNPFTKFPSFITVTSANNTASTNSLKTSDTGCTNLVPGDNIEWNGDGIARQITNCTTGDIGINPSLSSAISNVQNVEIRNWKSNTNFTPDFTLSQNGQYAPGQTNEQLWYNLIYGGKETSQDVCGSPSGGPGTGLGGQSCGPVTTDKSGATRTTANVGLADNTNGGASGTPGVPGGFSIGAYEAP